MAFLLSGGGTFPCHLWGSEKFQALRSSLPLQMGDMGVPSMCHTALHPCSLVSMPLHWDSLHFPGHVPWQSKADVLPPISMWHSQGL